jgi:multiple antibiotic resistance protein
MSLTAQKLIPLMFMMMGPIGLIPKFAVMTANVEAHIARRLARKTIGYSAVAMAIAGLIGTGILDGWGVSQGSLLAAAGLFLLLGALAPAARTGQSVDGQSPTTDGVMAMALSPLAFPSIVSPHAVGVFVLFCTYAATLQERFQLLAVVGAILALDYLAMLGARRFMAYVGMTPLLILGAVFGVLQTALGIEMVRIGLTNSLPSL